MAGTQPMGQPMVGAQPMGQPMAAGPADPAAGEDQPKLIPLQQPRPQQPGQFQAQAMGQAMGQPVAQPQAAAFFSDAEDSDGDF